MFQLLYNGNTRDVNRGEWKVFRLYNFFFTSENVFVQFRKCQWSILMMFLSIECFLIYYIIYIVNMTDKRKVCNISCSLVFRIKLLTDTNIPLNILYRIQTVENYKWNLKWLTIIFIMVSNEFHMFYRDTKIINNWFMARRKTNNIETYNIYIIHLFPSNDITHQNIKVMVVVIKS